MTTLDTSDAVDLSPADMLEGEYADVLPFGDPATAVLPDNVELPGPAIDPTRVRLTGLRPAEWKTEAACSGQVDGHDDPWHPGGDGIPGEFTPRARMTCIGCPIRLQCLAYGLALLPLGRVWGMYGGYTPRELQAIARRRGMADRVTAQHGTRARRVAGCDCGECKRAHAEYVADLRHQEKWNQSNADQPLRVPESVPTVTRLADLFDVMPEGGKCCSDMRRRVAQAKGDLAATARQLSRAVESDTGRTVAAMHGQLEKAQEAVERAEELLVEHEAAHAASESGPEEFALFSPPESA